MDNYPGIFFGYISFVNQDYDSKNQDVVDIIIRKRNGKSETLGPFLYNSLPLITITGSVGKINLMSGNIIINGDTGGLNVTHGDISIEGNIRGNVALTSGNINIVKKSMTDEANFIM